MKCGKCKPCLMPGMHKACLNPIGGQPVVAASDVPRTW